MGIDLKKKSIEKKYNSFRSSFMRDSLFHRTGDA
jgi:hypothetical protein